MNYDLLQTQLQQLQMRQQTIPQVEGIAGAGEYLKRMAPNSTAAVFDKDESIFYGLAVDANGNPAPIKIGRFTLEDAPEPGRAVTMRDLDSFKAEIIALLKEGKE